MTAPAGLEYKTFGVATAEIPAPLAGPDAKPQGYVKAIVAVTGIKDDVGDVIIPGAFARTLVERIPKVCLGHDWNRPIGRTLSIKELMPGDAGLPSETQAGDPWPKEAGAVVSEALYNLKTQDGRDAYEQAMFYKDTGECYQSIGYRVTPDGKSFKSGVRYIADLDLFEYGPVLHPANRLAGVQDVKADDGPLENNAVQPGESKTRYVKDSTFWGLPVGTPITPGMKPRGRSALAERRQGKTPDRAAGTTTQRPTAPAPGKAPRSVAHKPEKAKAERDAAGLFPEPSAPEGARVKPSDPQGFDHLHVADLVENEVGDKDPIARDHAIIGLIEEGVTPAELENDLRTSTDWPDGTSDADKEASIADVVGDYRASYRREAARQAAAPNTEPHPDDDNLAAEQEVADTGTEKPAPEPEKRDITTLDDSQLDKYIELARKGSMSNVGDKQAQFQQVWKDANAEKARRADAARRSVPAHPLDPQAYAGAMNQTIKRQGRAEDVGRRNAGIDRDNAAITASEQAAANAPKVLQRVPDGRGQKASRSNNRRVGFRGKGTANWAITSADGRAIVQPGMFEGTGRANVKLSGPQLDSLADRIAGITNAKGDRAPFTDPKSEGWVPGFRDSDGRSLEQAVSKVVDDWAGENGLTTSSHVKNNLANRPFGHAQGPAGQVDAEGFHPQERIQDVAAGDQVKLRDGSVKTITNVDEVTGQQRDRYGSNVFTITFDDGDIQKFSVGQRFDTKYAEGRNPDEEGHLNDPGMGYTSNSNLGQVPAGPAAALSGIDNPNPIPAGTRLIYTPDRKGDTRPRVGTMTNRYEQVNGRQFQVIEYDDGTFDAINARKLADDGKLTTKPTPEQEQAVRAQWGMAGPEGATEPAPALTEGQPDDTGATPPAFEQEKPPKIQKGAKLHTVTMPSGQKFYRGSKRDYTHAVVVTNNDGSQWAASFHGSEAGANGGATELRRRKHRNRLDIVPVDANNDGQPDSPAVDPAVPGNADATVETDSSTPQDWAADPYEAYKKMPLAARREYEQIPDKGMDRYNQSRAAGNDHATALAAGNDHATGAPKAGDPLNIEAAMPEGVDDVSEAPWFRPGQQLKFGDKKIETLPISSLLRTQSTADTLGDDTVQPYTGDEPVNVVRYQGKDWLFDGHHRVIGAMAAGRSDVPARVYDMDSPPDFGADKGGNAAKPGPGLNPPADNAGGPASAGPEPGTDVFIGGGFVRWTVEKNYPDQGVTVVRSSSSYGGKEPKSNTVRTDRLTDRPGKPASWSAGAAETPAAPAVPEAPPAPGEARPTGAAMTPQNLANAVTTRPGRDLSDADLQMLHDTDDEMAYRAAQLGKSGTVTPAHQHVKDEITKREAAAPTVSRAELDTAEGTTDEALGIIEGPDGELEADADVADRQDRVEALLGQADSGPLDLTGASDDEVTGARRDLVDELRFQNAVARRDQRQPPATGGQSAGDEGAATGGDGGQAPAAPPVETGPKVRPGVAGAAEDLADALEADDQAAQAAAVARLESSIRRSRSDSGHLDPLRSAVAADGGLQAAIDAGDVTPEMLREFATNLRDERRAQANEGARTRRTVKRLERERLRGLITQYDSELRRRNLEPDTFGGAVPSDETLATPAPALAGRGGQLQAQPWRFINASDEQMGQPDATSEAIQQASTQAFSYLATKYAPVLADASPEQLAAVDARLAKRPDVVASGVRSEAMAIALMLPKGEARDRFIAELRSAMTVYRSALDTLESGTGKG